MIGKVMLSQLARAIDAELIGNDRLLVGAVSIDTRSLKQGQLFVALSGNNTDGHHYVRQAFDKGAAGCIVEKVQPVDQPQLLVKNVRQALLQTGRFNRNRFEGLLTGLTGSCGKTSVREMLTTILKNAGSTLAPINNYNNDLGMPVTLSHLESHHRYAVIEMGTSAPGDIALLAQIARPHISIITNAEMAHLEKLKSVEGVAKEKGAILDYLPAEGFAILNRDSRFFSEWTQRARQRTVRLISFSLQDAGADVFASDIAHSTTGTHCHLHFNNTTFPVQLSFYGHHQVANACAATAAALAANISPELIIKGLQEAQPFQQRGQCFKGFNGSTVIDESYNANPASVRAAMDVLRSCQGQRIFVLGDMAELGDTTESAHRQVGEYAHRCGFEQLLTYGHSSQLAAKCFGAEGKHFADKASLNHYLRSCLSADTTVLIKGSNSMKMHETVQVCTETGKTQKTFLKPYRLSPIKRNLK
ncbi:MAG: UDP-N-acetylmuramoyl-tripeptide--D-alanyl-D-alanine ligase [Endozoicomonadaceae bacterium]|nr:UDP-N-acetylmuramoyl-tripeptide--D-alanyl-D-alanine ligase [Endozoicomonadaceae bacterium]